MAQCSATSRGTKMLRRRTGRRSAPGGAHGSIALHVAQTRARLSTENDASGLSLCRSPGALRSCVGRGACFAGDDRYWRSRLRVGHRRADEFRPGIVGAEIDSGVAPHGSVVTKTLALSGKDFGPLPLRAMEFVQPEGIDGFIGYDFFAKYTVCVDFPARAFWIYEPKLAAAAALALIHAHPPRVVVFR